MGEAKRLFDDFEFLELDRAEKIRATVRQYGESNVYMSFSGGRDSTILSAFLDVVLPNNNIPRVFANTGIELTEIVKFVQAKAEEDGRIVILSPSVPIHESLERDGYPFKSKAHARAVAQYQKDGLKSPWVRRYAGIKVEGKPDAFRPCPKILRYQFTDDFNIKVSDKCCLNLKEKPIEQWRKENKKTVSMTAILREEGGRRENAPCLSEQGGRIKFNPFAVVSNEFLDYLTQKYNIQLCKLYYPPYNFKRTGCKGCPFSIRLQEELDTLEQFFPSERKQAERIWKPVYDEYRRLGYRLKTEYNEQLTLF